MRKNSVRLLHSPLSRTIFLQTQIRPQRQRQGGSLASVGLVLSSFSVRLSCSYSGRPLVLTQHLRCDRHPVIVDGRNASSSRRAERLLPPCWLQQLTGPGIPQGEQVTITFLIPVCDPGLCPDRDASLRDFAGKGGCLPCSCWGAGGGSP